MTLGAHLSAGRGEGQRRRGWRRLPVREAASGQGATNAWPTGPTGRPSGRGPVGKAEGGKWLVGERKWRWATAGPKTEAEPNTLINLFDFFFEIQIFWQLWKFVQGDLKGILAWEFFLNSSSLLKDFRKV
jgi:hypothetical protein